MVLDLHEGITKQGFALVYVCFQIHAEFEPKIALDMSQLLKLFLKLNLKESPTKLQTYLNIGSNKGIL